jgi:hypothetical protein
MPVYTQNIPQGGDNLSVSQGQILANFQTLDTAFGVDHTKFSVVPDQGFHKQATMANQAFAAVSPAPGFGALFTSMAGTTGGTKTEAVYKRDGLGGVSILSAIKAWGIYDGLGTAVDGFNFDKATFFGGTFDATVEFLVDLPNAEYVVFGTVLDTVAHDVFYSTQTVHQFKLNVSHVGAPTYWAFLVLQS